MARDLGTSGDQVHAQAEAVLRFWLEATPNDRRFAVDPALDATIAERFGAMRKGVVAGHAARWRAAARTLLAAVILIDQFSRNIFRDDRRAYAADPLARALTREAIAKCWAAGMTADERRFLLMPLMHSEAMADQIESAARFADDPDSAAFAVAHARQIARFGRFPQRNAVLGRESTAVEVALLEEPGARF